MVLTRNQEVLVMATPSHRVTLCSPPPASPRLHQRLERDLMTHLTQFGELPIRRGTQTATGVLRSDGPDADALHTHALGWVRSQVGTGRYPRRVLATLELTLIHMTPTDVVAWLLGYLCTAPRLNP